MYLANDLLLMVYGFSSTSEIVYNLFDMDYVPLRKCLFICDLSFQKCILELQIRDD